MTGGRNKFIEKLIRVPLLIIDEFLMQDINKEQQAALLDQGKRIINLLFPMLPILVKKYLCRENAN